MTILESISHLRCKQDHPSSSVHLHLNYQGIWTFRESGVKSLSGIQGQKVAIVYKALSRASCWCQGLKNKTDLCASLICDLRVSAYLLTEAQDTQG